MLLALLLEVVIDKVLQMCAPPGRPFAFVRKYTIYSFEILVEFLQHTQRHW